MVAEPVADSEIQVIFMEQSNHRKGASRLKHVMAKLFLGKRLLLSDKVDLKCPRCCTRMDNVEKEGVVIDVCPFCQGLFLDDGEIEKLSQMAQQSGFATPAKKKTS
ncbi:MAG: zf-TFIIB domain-containing protein, partial [Nanoarchaeota archaeon]